MLQVVQVVVELGAGHKLCAKHGMSTPLEPGRASHLPMPQHCFEILSCPAPTTRVYCPPLLHTLFGAGLASANNPAERLRYPAGYRDRTGFLCVPQVPKARLPNVAEQHNVFRTHCNLKLQAINDHEHIHHGRFMTDHEKWQELESTTKGCQYQSTAGIKFV